MDGLGLRDSDGVVALQCVAAVVSDRRLKAARHEAEQLQEFQTGLGIAMEHEAVLLYLTWLVESGDTGRSIQRRLAALDLAERLSGRSPWSHRADVRRLLRGVYRSAELGAVHPQVDPLQGEHLQVITRSLSEPTPNQRLAAAAIALTNATSLSATALAQLRWVDVKIRREDATLTPPPRRHRRAGVVPGRSIMLKAGKDERACPVALLRQARLATGSAGLVFGKTGTVWDVERLRGWLAVLPEPETGSWLRPKLEHEELLRALDATLAPPARRIRDRAVMLLGYGAALRAREAVDLYQGAVSVVPNGLLISVPGRRFVTALPRDPRHWLCPVRAWQDWLGVLAGVGIVGEDLPAFVHIEGRLVTAGRLSREGLRRAVRLACAEVGLRGNYGFVSLRSGFIRTSIRDESALYRIAAQADFATLGGMARHERREQILRDNVAARLGL